MKKINLRGISEILSEKELKNVMGGSTNIFGGCLHSGTLLVCGSTQGQLCLTPYGPGTCGSYYNGGGITDPNNWFCACYVD